MALVVLTALLLLPTVYFPTSVADTTSTLTYDFHFEAPEIEILDDEQVYTIGGLDLDSRGGTPILPLDQVSLALPPGTTLLDVSVSCSGSRILGFIDSYPTNPVETSLMGGYESAYEYVPVAWESAAVYVMEGVQVVDINLRPLTWSEITGSLSFTSEFSITLTYEETPIQYLGDLDRVREEVDNPSVVPYLESYSTSEVLLSGSYDYLIITDDELYAPFQQLAEWKSGRHERGSVYEDILSIVVTLDDILSNSEFWGDPRTHGGTGNDTQTIVRNFIMAAHQEWGVEYVLIGGDDDIVPTRMVYPSMTVNGYDEVAADIYFSGLDGDWDTDGDGIYGELLGISSIVSDEADLRAEVFVGRATVSTEEGAWNFVNKTMAYEKGYVEQYGDDLLLIGELLDDEPTYGDDYKNEVYEYALADEGLDCTTLYEGEGTFSRTAVLENLNSNVHIVNHMGHGNFESFADIYISDVDGIENDLPMIIYSQACMVAGFDEKEDDPGDCIAEEFVQSEHGAVAFIGNSRYGWYSSGSTSGSSQKFDKSFFSQVFDDDVTELGRALSYSKEEWVASASSAGTVRWVYLELNLLGDPETRVQMSGRALHDLEVQELSTERCILNQTCVVTVSVQNVGQSEDAGALQLKVDEEVVANTTIDLGPGETTTVQFEWVPQDGHECVLSAEVVCPEDSVPDNDRMDVHVMVDRRVTSDEIWHGNVTLSGGLVIEPGVTVTAIGCIITFAPSDLTYLISVGGALICTNTTLGGSQFRIEADGGDLAFDDCIIEGTSDEGSKVVGGSVTFINTTIEGGGGWSLSGTNVVVNTSSFLQNACEWTISNSTVYVVGLEGIGGCGIRFLNSTGTFKSSSWQGGTSGVSLDRCPDLALQDLILTENGMDLDVEGDEASDFLLDAQNVQLTYGALSILQGLENTTVEGATGSLYLVGCQGVLVNASHLRNVGNGLAVIDSQDIEVRGSAFENCSIGVMFIDSQGSLWGNDFLYNGEQVRQVRSTLTFGNEYPIGGNHWSDLQGEDLMEGEDQDQVGSDGIFDIPYDQDGIYDAYPKVGRCSYIYDYPEASFITGADEADRAHAMTFTFSGSSGIGISNWTWELGDGTTAYGQSVDHIYATLGSKLVVLTVTDHKGLVDVYSRWIEVVNLAPECDFTFSPTLPAPGETVEIQDLSSDPDGTIVAWSWDLGDGNSSYESSFSHTYMTEGEYQLSLTVYDADGKNDTMVRTVVVGNELPIVAFAWSPSTVTILNDVIFTSQSSDVDGWVTSWSWDFGDGYVGSGSVVSHRYATLGTYYVTLYIQDEDGATNQTTRAVTVVNSKPVAVIDAPSTVLSLEEVQFNDRSYDADGHITYWSWNFGDGNISSSPSPTHVFQAPGTYQVTLTVKDDGGDLSVAKVTLVVLNRPPTVNISVPSGEHWSLEVLDFSAIGEDEDGVMANYTWQMGDGVVLYGDTVSHAYSAPGNYSVVLTGMDDAGGETSISTWIVIGNLVPQATIDVEVGNDPMELVLISQTSDGDGEVVTFEWDFGDGTTGLGESVRHEFSTEGEFLITLNAYDDLGAMVTATCSVTVQVPDLFLQDPAISHLDDEDVWVFTASIINSADLEVNVTLVIIADGNEYTERYTVGEQPALVELRLENFTDGEVTVILETSDGWDSDLSNNSWTGEVEREAGLPYWTLGIGLAVVAVAILLLVRRRR